MSSATNLNRYHVVRLDAGLFPVNESEAALNVQYGLDPIEVEAFAQEEIIPRIADCDALVVVSSALPTAVIESLNRCRVISRRGIGTDKIDVETATRAGILVTNVPEFCSGEIADHTIALLLSLARKVPRMSQAMDEGAWSRARKESLSNQRLAGRVLGLVGFGGGAQAVARRAKPFGLRLLATRRNLAASRHDAAELGVEMVDLDTLLAESDYVSLHLPLDAETYHLLDEAKLRKMKPGTFLINTARGAIVDEMALVAALSEDRLAGAALDTFEHIDVFSGREGRPDHPLLGLDNVVLTPHIASESVQAQWDVAKGSVENLVSVLSGRWPLSENIVNPRVVPRVPLSDYDTSLFED